jgi:3'-5' exoribonuclease
MKRMKNDIQANDQVYTSFALESMKLRTNGNGKKYLKFLLSDVTGKIKGYKWDEPEFMYYDMLKEKTIIAVVGNAILFNGSLILNVKEAWPLTKDEYDLSDFAGTVKEGIPYWEAIFDELIEKVQNNQCRRVIDSFFGDRNFKTLFMEAPDGVSDQYGHIGKLLKHTVKITSQAFLMAENYPGRLDRDLLMTGAMLHDIGKIRELYWEVGCSYTAAGKLVGHMGLGLMMLEQQVKGLAGVPEDLTLHLSHMILSHHGEPAWGSPVKPDTPEAVVLHMLHHIDAKLDSLKDSTPRDVLSGDAKIIGSETYKDKYATSKLTIKEETLV